MLGAVSIFSLLAAEIAFSTELTEMIISAIISAYIMIMHLE
jgi:hypothetical protein